MEDPGDRLVGAQRRDDRERIGDVPIHPRPERLDAEQDGRRARCRQSRAEVAQSLDAGAHDEGGGPVVVGEVQAVIALVGLDHRLVPPRSAPVETPGVDEHAAERAHVRRSTSSANA